MADKPENPPARDATIRDVFATAAVQGMMANIPGHVKGLDWRKNVAAEAYQVADAMLHERTKTDAK